MLIHVAFEKQILKGKRISIEKKVVSCLFPCSLQHVQNSDFVK